MFSSHLNVKLNTPRTRNNAASASIKRHYDTTLMRLRLKAVCTGAGPALVCTSIYETPVKLSTVFDSLAMMTVNPQAMDNFQIAIDKI